MLVLLLELLVTLVRFQFYLIRGLVVTFLPFLVAKKDISGQIVLVTGAGQGIGALMARKIASLGAKLVLWDVNAGW